MRAVRSCRGSSSFQVVFAVRLPDDRFDVAVCRYNAGSYCVFLALVVFKSGMIMALHRHTKKQKAAIRKSRKPKGQKSNVRKQSKKR